MTRMSDDLSGSEQRRKRNRVSQRQFRERRSRYLKELEERVQFFSRNESERNSKLIVENRALQKSHSRTREQLLRIKTIFDELYETFEKGDAGDHITSPASKADSPTTSMRSSPSENQLRAGCNPTSQRDVVEHVDGQLLDLSKGTGLTPRTWDPLVVDDQDVPVHHAMEQVTNKHSSDVLPPDVVASESHLQDNGGCQRLNQLALLPVDSSIFNLDLPHAAFPAFLAPFDEAGLQQNALDTFARPSLQIFYEPQEGPLLQTLYMLIDQRFKAAAGASLSERIDDMITLLEDYLKLVGGFGNLQTMDQACLIAMIVFVKHASPLPAVMWFTSSCYSLVRNVIRWRLTRSSPVIHSLPPNYEPSELQLSTQHPSVIDWIAVAPLRDKLIQYFNDRTALDRVFTDMMEHVVVEVADISIILTGVDPGPGFLGVWNIFNVVTNGMPNADLQALCTPDALELRDGALLGLYQMHKFRLFNMSSICQCTTSGRGYWIPVPLSTLLSSPDLARQLYHHLAIYDSHKYWKFDLAFFEKYPQLKFEGFMDMVAKGRSYRVASNWIRASQAPAFVGSKWPDLCPHPPTGHVDAMLEQNH